MDYEPVSDGQKLVSGDLANIVTGIGSLDFFDLQSMVQSSSIQNDPRILSDLQCIGVEHFGHSLPPEDNELACYLERMQDLQDKMLLLMQYVPPLQVQFFAGNKRKSEENH